MAAMTDSRVKPHVRAAAVEISQKFGVTNIGGFATSGHISNSDHYKGLALDVMTSLKGQAVANFAQANAGRLSITYIIWNRAIWDSRNSRGWERYTGSSPHTDHVHISFHPTGGNGVDNVTQPSPTGGSASPDGCASMLTKIFTVPFTKGK